jgi:pyruvate formate lyase activating enzyme
MLRQVIDSGCVDYIAMDIKNSFEKYHETIGLDKMPEEIKESIGIIMSSNVDYEFRTTVVNELHNAEDIESISREISGAKRYFLQKFKDVGSCLVCGLNGISDDVAKDFVEILKPLIPNTKLRGY